MKLNLKLYQKNMNLYFISRKRILSRLADFELDILIFIKNSRKAMKIYFN